MPEDEGSSPFSPTSLYNMPYKNREDKNKCQKKHYTENKEYYIKKAYENKQNHIKRNRKYVDEYLFKHPCVDCDEKDIIVLDFDHIDDNKTHNVCDLIYRGYSLKRIQEEIDKCDVRCANCHRRITHKRRTEIYSEVV